MVHPYWAIGLRSQLTKPIYVKMRMDDGENSQSAAENLQSGQCIQENTREQQEGRDNSFVQQITQM